MFIALSAVYNHYSVQFIIQFNSLFSSHPVGSSSHGSVVLYANVMQIHKVHSGNLKMLSDVSILKSAIFLKCVFFQGHFYNSEATFLLVVVVECGESTNNFVNNTSTISQQVSKSCGTPGFGGGHRKSNRYDALKLKKKNKKQGDCLLMFEHCDRNGCSFQAFL